jgi:hypothetical protein
LGFALVAYGCGATDEPPGNAAGPTNFSTTAATPASTPAPAAHTATNPPDAGQGVTGSSAAEANAEPAANDGGAATVSGDDEAASSQQSFEGTAGLTEKKREMSGVAVLRAVRTASHRGFDRVVFEFEGREVPGYRLEYVDRPVRQCGSGRPVRVAGDGWLLVRLEPAKAHTEAGEPTVKDRERRLRHPNLKELRLICDFEAQVEWVLGLGSPKRYRVLELQNPARLVLDVRR